MCSSMNQSFESGGKASQAQEEDKKSWKEQITESSYWKQRTMLISLLFLVILAFSYSALWVTLFAEDSDQRDTNSLIMGASLGYMGFNVPAGGYAVDDTKCSDSGKGCYPTDKQVTKYCNSTNDVGKCMFERIPSVYTEIDSQPHLGWTAVGRTNQIYALLFALTSLTSFVVFANTLAAYMEKSYSSVIFATGLVLITVPFLADIVNDKTVKYTLTDKSTVVSDWISKPIMTDFFTLIFVFFYAAVVFMYDYTHKSASHDLKHHASTFVSQEEQSVTSLSDLTLAVMFQLILWLSLNHTDRVVNETDVQLTIAVGVIIGFGFLILNDLVSSLLYNDPMKEARPTYSSSHDHYEAGVRVTKAKHNGENYTDGDEKAMFLAFVFLVASTFFVGIYVSWWATLFQEIETASYLHWFAIIIGVVQLVSLFMGIVQYQYSNLRSYSFYFNLVLKNVTVAVVVAYLLFHNDSNDVSKSILEKMSGSKCSTADHECGYKLRVKGWESHQVSGASHVYGSDLTSMTRCSEGLTPSWKCVDAGEGYKHTLYK